MPSTVDARAIGIDVGGTRVRAAVIDLTGRVLARRDRSNPKDDSAEELIRWVADAIAQLRGATGVGCDSGIGVGLALPGTLDTARGAVKRSVNLPFLEGCLLGKMLADRTGLHCVLVTDAEAATWGEYTVRTPRPQRFVHLRLGTGVACGVVIGRRLQPLDQDRVTHLEVLIVDRSPNAIACRCRLAGCLETVASGHALDAHARQLGLSGGLANLAEAWRSGDPSVRRVIQGTAEAIGVALRNLATQYQPDVISLGGGVVTRLPWLLDSATVALCSPGHDTHTDRICVVERARLGDDAGLIGAGLLTVKRARSDANAFFEEQM